MRTNARKGVHVRGLINSSRNFVLLAVMLMLATFGECSAADTNTLKIAMLAVGSADSTVFIFPNGKTMLVDCGEKVNCKNDVIPFLNRHKITHLDYVMITHPHKDHNGGGAGISLLTKAGLVNSSTIKYDFKSFKIGQELSMEGTNVLILNAYNVVGANPNTNCITFRMEYNGYVYQHGGDLDDPSIQDKIVTKFGDKVQCHFFHTFHHMYGGMSYDYLLKANAEIALVSCDKAIMAKTNAAWATFMKSCDYLSAGAGNGGRFIRYYLTGVDGNVVMRISSGTQWTKENYTNLSDVIPDFTGSHVQ